MMYMGGPLRGPRMEGVGKRLRQPAPSLNPRGKKPPKREKSDEIDKPQSSAGGKLVKAKEKLEAAIQWVEA
eukprot:5932504-Karenia_brevis.AAC.1